MDLLAQETAIDHRVEDLLNQRQRAPEVAADRIAQPRASERGTDHGWATQAAKHHFHSLDIDFF